MNYEDIDEDFEYAGECAVCDEMLDMSESGFCDTCKRAFCWSNCGGWHGIKHICNECRQPGEEPE